MPLGASGRPNFYGLPAQDERNAKLTGPAGLERFDDMYRTDPHIRRLVLMAWTPIIAGTWTLEPHGGDEASDQDREIADTIWWALTHYMNPNFYEHLAALGPILLRSGFCPFEQIWSTTEYQGKTLTLPRKLDLRLPRSVWRWWQDDYGELTHIGQILPNKPDVVIPATELTYYRLASEGDNWVGTSLLRHAYGAWYRKDKLERIDVIGQERKAVGVPVCYPPTNASDQQRDNTEVILQNLHLSEVGYIMAPGPHHDHAPEGEGWFFDVIKFDSSSGSGIQESLTYYQQSIAASFLGDFMELGHHNVGARATADIQENPYMNAVKALAQTGPIPPLNQLIARICAFNWPNADGPPQLKLSVDDDESLAEIGTAVQALVAAKALTPDPALEEWLRKVGGMPPADPEVQAKAQEAQMAGYDQAINPPAPVVAPAGAPTKGGGAANPPRQKPGAPAKGRALEAAAPDAKWYERLLSQDRIREALDGARQSVEDAAHTQALTLARQIAYHATNGSEASPDLSPLEDALTGEYERLYGIGHETVRQELAKQRLRLQLDAPGDVTAAEGARLARARLRGRHSARKIRDAITGRVGAARISGLLEPAALQTAAEQAATGQLHTEALLNASSQVNDGRADGAMQDGGVIGGIYTSVLDERACDPCITADTGAVLSVEDALALGPPNPDCEGSDRCRCMILWVLSGDPVAP